MAYIMKNINWLMYGKDAGYWAWFTIKVALLKSIKSGTTDTHRFYNISVNLCVSQPALGQACGFLWNCYPNLLEIRLKVPPTHK